MKVTKTIFITLLIMVILLIMVLFNFSAVGSNVSEHSVSTVGYDDYIKQDLKDLIKEYHENH